ncbi:MAG: DNA primase [Candidatus Omnitrophica bacterium]|nr:DNA primase [Candidatus Omnitrophota bacterium]
MSNKFSDHLIDEIREKCNIAEVIAQYIPLKRAGRNFRANCPFHKEKTPSFMVSPEKGIFHCFGCGAGGNVFNFIMKNEGLEFPQVVRMLAEKTGVKLPATPTFSREQKEISNLYQINELACSWYQDNLKKEIGRVGVEYLKSRKLTAQTVVTFRLGFAPANNGLLNFMRSKGIKQELLEKVGLALRKQGGPYYDRFKQRLMFPIFDSRSRILGFGARVLDNSLPKYMNSPETTIYSKGNQLYGLNFAKQEIKSEDFCIIVEGYTDLISVYQSGIHNVVASLGTALTPAQIRLLKRYTPNVTVIFDADRAGEMASLRSLDLLIEEDLHVKITSLPKDEDPDSFLRKFGKEKFWQKVTQSPDLFDYKLNLLRRNHDLDTVEGRVNIASHMLPTIHRVQNMIRRGGYVKRLAQEFSRGDKSLGEEWILAELKKVKRNFADYAKESFVRSKVVIKRPAEEMVLKILLEDQGAFEEVKKHLSLEDFQDLRIREAVRIVFQLHTQGQQPGAAKLISCLQGQESAELVSCICSKTYNFIDRSKCLDDCIQRINRDNLKIRLNKLQREIKLAQGWGHKDKIVELMHRYNKLIKVRSKKG